MKFAIGSRPSFPPHTHPLFSFSLAFSHTHENLDTMGRVLLDWLLVRF